MTMSESSETEEGHIGSTKLGAQVCTFHPPEPLPETYITVTMKKAVQRDIAMLV